MSRNIHCLAAVAAVALAGSAFAQTGALGADVKADAKLSMPTLDKNADGMLSKDEAKANAKLAKKFDSLDTNKDGSLDQAEFAKFEAEGKGKAGASKDSAAPAPTDKPATTEPAPQEKPKP